MRQEGISWWSSEIPNDEEYKRGIQAIKNADYKVDYIITHTCPSEIIKMYLHHIPNPHDGELTGFFDYLMYDVDFKCWFFGHWHADNYFKIPMRGKTQKFRALLFDVVNIEEYEEVKNNEY